MAFIELNNISKTYKDTGYEVKVLDNLCWQVQQGRTVAVLGASGVGKSTLLHILGALDRPNEGKLLVDGQDIFMGSSEALAHFRNRTIGFVFQFHHLLPEFSALENVIMPALIAGQNKSEASARARDLLDKVGLSARLSHRLSQLSGGEQQRVAFARALVLSPRILLADEPTGNLDQKTGQVVNELILQLNQEYNLTTIVVTHNQALAELMQQRFRLIEGSIEQVD